MNKFFINILQHCAPNLQIYERAWNSTDIFYRPPNAYACDQHNSWYVFDLLYLIFAASRSSFGLLILSTELFSLPDLGTLAADSDFVVEMLDMREFFRESLFVVVDRPDFVLENDLTDSVSETPRVS